MYKVDSTVLRNATEEMENQIRTMNRAISDVEDVMRGLGRLSGMDEVKRALRTECDRMSGELRSHIQMLTSLCLIAETYETCENSVISYAEEISARKTPDFTWISLPTYPAEVNDVINQIQWQII